MKRRRSRRGRRTRRIWSKRSSKRAGKQQEEKEEEELELDVTKRRARLERSSARRKQGGDFRTAAKRGV